ncbi:ketol-acid reductoisomerase [Halalkalicoccus tibetensis]|uniref:Ketol-acid reductoisomerase n=1 Tax=Halalkalicoccus tibetensis TaxID=175632 RepID=A0ABD5VBK6_9EURY
MQDSTTEEATIFYEDDADMSILNEKTIAIIGYGNQGRAQALNMQDSGVEDIIVGNRSDDSRKQAREDGFEDYDIAEAAERADIIFLLIPDEVAPGIYQEEIEPGLEAGNTVNFASGYNITYDFIEPTADLDTIMVAPRMIGDLVRELYEEGDGAPSMIAVNQDYSGNAQETALALSKAIGSTRSGVIEGTFEMETKIDLLTEQALIPLFFNAIAAKYEIEREAGIPGEVILLEQYLSQEMAHIFEVMGTDGFIGQLPLHSQTSQYGQMSRAEAYNREEMKSYMRERLREIETGSFAREWTNEQQAGYPMLNRLYKEFGDTEMIQKEQETIEKLGLGDE